MSIVYNSTETAKVINRAIDNSQGTTTQSQGAISDGLIINEDLQNIVQCTGGYTNPFVVKTISGVPPVEFHAVGKSLKSWSISGNTDTGVSVGDKTANLCDESNLNQGYYNTTSPYAFMADTKYRCFSLNLSAGTYSILVYGNNIPMRLLRISSESRGLGNVSIDNEPYTFELTDSETVYISLRNINTTENFTGLSIMMNVGESVLPYEPYGQYKISISCGNVTTTAYISDVLRKSSGEIPVYDIMYSDGTITRNVDTDGTPLETPTTETYTPVTISTIWGYNTFDVDTTVTPSSVTIEYYDN